VEGVRIFLVGGDIPVADSMRSQLEQEGYFIVSHHHGTSAEDPTILPECDVVVLLSMLAGPRLATVVKDLAREARPQVPVITTRHEPEAILRHLRGKGIVPGASLPTQGVKMKQIAIVGGEWAILSRGLLPKYEQLGLHCAFHHSWDERVPPSSYPKEIDAVIVLKSVIGHSTSDQAEKAAKAAGLPVAVVDHALSRALPVLISTGILPDTSKSPPVTAADAISVAPASIKKVRTEGRTPAYNEVTDVIAEELGTNGDTGKLYTTKLYGRQLAETAHMLPPPPAPPAQEEHLLVSNEDVVEAARLVLADKPYLAMGPADVFLVEAQILLLSSKERELQEGWQAVVEGVRNEFRASLRAMKVSAKTNWKATNLKAIANLAVDRMLVVQPDVGKWGPKEIRVDLLDPWLRSVFGSSMDVNTTHRVIREVLEARSIKRVDVKVRQTMTQLVAEEAAPEPREPGVDFSPKIDEIVKRLGELEDLAISVTAESVVKQVMSLLPAELQKSVQEALVSSAAQMKIAEVFKEQVNGAREAANVAEQNVSRLMGTVSEIRRALESDQVLRGRVRELEDHVQALKKQIGEVSTERDTMYDRLRAFEDRPALTEDRVRELVGEALKGKSVKLTLSLD